MPERWGHGGGRRRDGRRPPWWPEGEPWPPEGGGEAWRGMRGRFMRRAGAFVALLAITVVAAVTAVVWLVSGALTSLFGPTDAPGVVIGLAVVLALIGLGLVARVVRRAAAPIGDLVEASGRVEAGELGVTVHERGAREIRSLARSFNAMSRRLAETDAERRRLLADVSHELRTPLAVIQGTVEGIVDGVYPATPQTFDPILDEVRVMERLVEDLRTLSLADAGQLALHREPTALAALADDVVTAFRPRADAARVTLAVEAGPELPEASVDPVRIRQVLSNLLTNALRASPAGGRVTVELRAEAAGVGLAVVDTGVGMEAGLVERAFDRFSRAGDSAGSGLGLSIVRELVAAHGGSVTLASVPGTGTTVRVILPA